MKTRIIKIMIFVLLIALLMFTQSSMALSGQMVQEAYESFGPITHYNGIIFEDMTSLQADSEGAVAVGGNAVFCKDGFSYDIGASGSGILNGEYIFIGDYTNEKGYPSLLLGGTVDTTCETTKPISSVYGGRVAIKASNQHAYENGSLQFDCGNGLEYASDTLIDAFFEGTKTRVQSSAELFVSKTGGTVSESAFKNLDQVDLKNYEVNTLSKNTKILILTIESGSSIQIGELHWQELLSSYDTVIFNILAKDVSFTGGAVLYNGNIIDTSLPMAYEGNKVLKLMAEKVVWNLPNATSVSVKQYGVVGSVIAPKADTYGEGGSINGVLVTNNFKQTEGMELHAFRIGANQIWDWYEEETTTTTTTTTTTAATTVTTTEPTTTTEPSTTEPDTSATSGTTTQTTESSTSTATSTTTTTTTTTTTSTTAATTQTSTNTTTEPETSSGTEPSETTTEPASGSTSETGTKPIETTERSTSDTTTEIQTETTTVKRTDTGGNPRTGDRFAAIAGAICGIAIFVFVLTKKAKGK